MAADRNAPEPVPLLTRILRDIRGRRGYPSAQAARAMGLPLRTYQHFESAKGRLQPPLVHRFAQALDADGYAILLALEFGAPDLAVRCLDNKLVSVLLGTLQDFEAKAGEDLARLDMRGLIRAFTAVFDTLLDEAREYDAYVERWMLDNGPGALRDDGDGPDG